MNEELVTIIIPTFNASYRLVKAVESVLNQSYKNIELIVVDDNNPNSKGRLFTEEIMRKYNNDLNPRVLYLRHDKNKNGAAARNTGLKYAKGTFIGFLDDDDEYYQERVEKCVEALTLNQDFDSVYTDSDIYLNDTLFEKRKATVSGLVWKDLILNEGLLGTGSNLFFRKVCLEDVLGFDERFLRYQDVEFMIRLVEKHKLLALNEALVRKNIEKTNIPKYEKYYENKLLIFDKFDYLLAKLSKEELNDFYVVHYTTLLDSALDSMDKQYIRQATNNLSKYKKISLKTKIKCMFPRLYAIYSKR